MHVLQRPVEITALSRLRCLIVIYDLQLGHALEPHIGNTSTIPWQVIKAIKSVEMINDDCGHRLRFREPQIDGDAAPAFLIWCHRAPTDNAAAIRTKMKADCPASPGVDPRRA